MNQTATTMPAGQTRPARTAPRRSWLSDVPDLLTRIVAGLIAAAAVSYVVGFTLWTVVISFTDSTLLPEYSFVGFKHYWALLRSRIWQVAYVNLTIYGLGFILGPMLEENLRRAMLISQGDPTIFMRSPLSLSLLLVAVVVLALVLSPSISRKREEAFTE